MGSKKPNFLKRAKVAAAYTLFGYDAARNTRYRAMRGTGSIRSEESELGEYDRDAVTSALLDFRRNNPVVASISRLRKADVVGRGIIPQAATGNDDLNTEIERQWAQFCSQPDPSQNMDMREIQQQMSDCLLFYGDCGLIIGPNQINFIDGSRIGNPQGKSSFSEDSPFQNGVEINASGRPVRYWFGKRVNGMLRDVKAVSANNFLPFFRRQRPVQYRGIPELAPVLNTLQDCDEYDKIEMIAAKVSASLSVVVKQTDATIAQQINSMADDEGDDNGRLERFEPGRYDYLEPGEDISVVSSNGRPNVDGIQWVSYLLRKVGAAVGIPLEFLLMEIGGSSFSASQGVVLQYQQTVESLQTDIIRVMDRLYRRWMIQRIAEGSLTIPEGIDQFAVRWQRPAFRWINRAAQVKADMEYFRAGAMSLDDITAPFGYTAEDVLRRKMQNIHTAKKIAETEDGITWRDLINPFQTNISESVSKVIPPDEENEGIGVQNDE
jgi:lambda family phage portal protein